MRVLITGGAGFIGSHLTERLLEGGAEVLVLDNFATGRRDNLTPHPRLTLSEGTIVDVDFVNQAFERFRPEQVVHAAASYKDPENWAEDAATNVVGTSQVVQAARRFGVERFIYFQTALCYGLIPQEQPITLAHPLNPEASSYAISKTAGESYIRLSGLNWISFRLANAYGPRNLSGPLPTFYQRLATGKPCFVMDTRRDFLFVDDLVRIVLSALSGRGRSGIYHVSSGADLSIQQLFHATVKALGISPEPQVEVRPRGKDDAFTILLDPSHTHEEFDWKVSTPFETGVARAVGYYQRFGVERTFTHLKLDDKPAV